MNDSTTYRGHKLLTKEILEKLPPLYSGEEKGLESCAVVKFFTPYSNWTWYASEFDGEDIFFGLVIGLEIELGYFSLSELERVRDTWGIQVERDVYFKPRSLRQLQEQHEKERGGA